MNITTGELVFMRWNTKSINISINSKLNLLKYIDNIDYKDHCIQIWTIYNKLIVYIDQMDYFIHPKQFITSELRFSIEDINTNNKYK